MPPKIKHEVAPLETSWEYLEGKAAHYWGMKPWEFDELIPDHKAQALAHFIVNREVENYYNLETIRERPDSSKPTGRIPGKRLR